MRQVRHAAALLAGSTLPTGVRESQVPRTIIANVPLHPWQSKHGTMRGTCSTAPGSVGSVRSCLAVPAILVVAGEPLLPHNASRSSLEGPVINSAAEALINDPATVAAFPVQTYRTAATGASPMGRPLRRIPACRWAHCRCFPVSPDVLVSPELAEPSAAGTWPPT